MKKSEKCYNLGTKRQRTKRTVKRTKRQKDRKTDKKKERKTDRKTKGQKDSIKKLVL